MDPRWELVHQLLQYKKFKDASQGLAEMARLQRDLMERWSRAGPRTPSTGP